MHTVLTCTSSLMIVALLRERSAVVILRPKSARTILKNFSTKFRPFSVEMNQKNAVKRR